MIGSLILFLSLFASVGAGLAQTATHPQFHDIHLRIKMQLKHIDKGVQLGKLTVEQAQVLKDHIKEVEDQIEADYQANGKEQLTGPQEKQLNESLGQNADLFHWEKDANRTFAPTPSR